MCETVTMLLGRLRQCWTFPEPTSHDATLLVTSHGFLRLLASFSIAGTKINTHMQCRDADTNTHLRSLSACLVCSLSDKELSGCLVTVLVYLSSLALLQLIYSFSHTHFFKNKPPTPWESLSWIKTSSDADWDWEGRLHKTRFYFCLCFFNCSTV